MLQQQLLIAAPQLRFDRILNLRHPWDVYLRHVLFPDNAHVVASRLRMRGKEISMQEEADYNDAKDTWAEHINQLATSKSSKRG